jgi:hypothetical protein
LEAPEWLLPSIESAHPVAVSSVAGSVHSVAACAVAYFVTHKPVLISLTLDLVVQGSKLVLLVVGGLEVVGVVEHSIETAGGLFAVVGTHC